MKTSSARGVAENEKDIRLNMRNMSRTDARNVFFFFSEWHLLCGK